MSQAMSSPEPSAAVRPDRDWSSSIGVKVPAVTAMFWLVKLITTGLGESTSDFFTLKKPTETLILSGLALLTALIVQFSVRQYNTIVYWVTVSMVAIFGTAFADEMHRLGVPRLDYSIGYAIALTAWLVIWYAAEHTLDIHSINTPRRELFYWVTVILTFALGTALGDLTAFQFRWGTLKAAGFFAILIVIPGLLYKLIGLNSVVTFWATYIITRPLGASLADYLGLPIKHGGAGYGIGSTAMTGTIIAEVLILCLWARDGFSGIRLAATRPRGSEASS